MNKLVCGKNPKTLGIEDAGGSWDMVKFGEHVKNCETCSLFVGRISRYLAGKGGRAGKRVQKSGYSENTERGEEGL